jgi:hypothetical protein
MKSLVSCLLVLVIVGSALHAARHVLDDGSVLTWRARLEEERERGEELDAEMEERRQLMEDIHALVAEFAHRKATLAQTVQAIEELAVVQRPEYLGQLMELEVGDTLEDKIAHNIVRHFEAQHRRLKNSMTRQALRYAERELAAYLKHDHASPDSIH